MKFSHDWFSRCYSSSNTYHYVRLRDDHVLSFISHCFYPVNATLVIREWRHFFLKIITYVQLSMISPHRVETHFWTKVKICFCQVRGRSWKTCSLSMAFYKIINCEEARNTGDALTCHHLTLLEKPRWGWKRVWLRHSTGNYQFMNRSSRLRVLHDWISFPIKRPIKRTFTQQIYSVCWFCHISCKDEGDSGLLGSCCPRGRSLCCTSASGSIGLRPITGGAVGR